MQGSKPTHVSNQDRCGESKMMIMKRTNISNILGPWSSKNGQLAHIRIFYRSPFHRHSWSPMYNEQNDLVINSRSSWEWHTLKSTTNLGQQEHMEYCNKCPQLFHFGYNYFGRFCTKCGITLFLLFEILFTF